MLSGSTGTGRRKRRSNGPTCTSIDRKSTRLNSSHSQISYAVFCLKKKNHCVYATRRARLEELYLMHDSGMLIRHWSRTQGMVHDRDIMCCMPIVLQEHVRDTFHER